MGLFNVLKNAGSSAYDALQKNASEVETMMDQMRYYSESQLLSALKTGPYARKSAASLLLQQEYGYSQSQVADVIRNSR